MQRWQLVVQRNKIWIAVVAFAAAITIASMGRVYLPIALGCVVALYVGLNIVPIRDVYDSIEWPIIVLLGSMIPIGSAGGSFPIACPVPIPG